MTDGQAVRPANTNHVIAINQGRERLTMDEPAAPILLPRKFAALGGAGHAVVLAQGPVNAVG